MSGDSEPGPSDPKELLHSAIAAAAKESPALEGAALTRWVVLAEFSMPDAEKGFAKLSGSADGANLRTWEVNGFLVTALMDSIGE